MAIKQTELYSSFWASCDELRGGMDASQYKSAPYDIMQELPKGKTRLRFEKVKG